MDSYVLGILWSLGVFREEGGYFEMRAENPYHLEIAEEHFRSQSKTSGVHLTRSSRGNDQYRLCLYDFQIEELRRIGWAEWRSKERSCPTEIEDRSAFLRAYFELHAVLGCIRRRERNGKYRTALRLRVYGNDRVVEYVNQVLRNDLDIPVHKVQFSSTGTAHIVLTNLEQIRQTLEYIDGQPCCKSWWSHAHNLLSQF